MDGGRWTVDGGRWTVDGGRWTVNGGRWTVDGEQWTVDSRKHQQQKTQLRGEPKGGTYAKSIKRSFIEDVYSQEK